MHIYIVTCHIQDRMYVYVCVRACIVSFTVGNSPTPH